MHLSVVIPVRNEAENILPLLAEIHAALEGRGEFEVIYVDDGSTDETPRILAEAQGRYPRLRVMAHAGSCGQSAAVVTGFRAARGDWIATLDGDGQNDPADIPRLVAARDAGTGAAGAPLQLVAGYRRKRQETQPRERSAGCIFRNPPGGAAGRLIDEAGLKGTRVGDAQVSPVHANFIVNLGAARAAD